MDIWENVSPFDYNRNYIKTSVFKFLKLTIWNCAFKLGSISPKELNVLLELKVHTGKSSANGKENIRSKMSRSAKTN